MTCISLVFLRVQKQVNTEEYGPTMADLERQIATHNILHKEIETYNSQLCVSSAGSKVIKHKPGAQTWLSASPTADQMCSYPTCFLLSSCNSC